MLWLISRRVLSDIVGYGNAGKGAINLRLVYDVCLSEAKKSEVITNCLIVIIHRGFEWAVHR